MGDPAGPSDTEPKNEEKPEGEENAEEREKEREKEKEREAEREKEREREREREKEKERERQKAAQGTQRESDDLKKKQLPKMKIKAKEKSKRSLADLKQEVRIDDHILPLEEFYKRYETNPEKGLTQEVATHRLERDGPNALTPTKSTPQIVVFCRHMFSGFALILWISSTMCFIAYQIKAQTEDNADKSNLYLSVLILIVVVVTGIFGYFQDRTSSRIMDSFKKMITHTATVIRDGKAQTIPTEYLVKGDLVLIKFGNKIPADVRIIENFGLKVDNSSLTGETEPQPRTVEMTSENPMETQNLAFYSTSAMEGTCKAIVFQTGDKTIIGRLASLTIGLKRGDSPMKIEIRHFVKLITVVALFLSIIFTSVAMILGNNVVDCLIYFIAIMVANIPEGLLVTVTLALTLTAKKMARKNCLIKSLDSVETLGSTSTICSDKTGTLTQNRMTVADIMYGFRICPVHYGPDRSSTVANEFNPSDADFQNLMRCGRLCLRAQFDTSDPANLQKPVLDRQVDGDASEAGILKCVECIMPNTEEYRKENPKIMEVPFNSTNKYQLSIHRTAKGNILLMKGAPEKVLDLCSTVSSGGRTIPLTPQTKQQVIDMLNLLGSKGERVLGFCDFELPDPINTEYSQVKKNYPTSNLRFLGLMALIDPPREAVPDAVNRCRSAGISVIMVTGDHPVTAEAIAKKVGIIKGETRQDVAKRLKIPVEEVNPEDVTAIVVSGDHLRHMTENELDEVLKNHDEIVFARTTPTQKLLIVEGCQRLGYITAVTGDGVNDSPALKKADIGVAMGITGSEVSKQAADMILLDDNFASIVTGVEEGRIIFDNLKKSIAYVLTSNIPEMAPFIAYILFEFPMPLSVIAILIVDIGTDMLPAIALAYERAESDIMLRRPRNPFQDKMVNRRLIWMAYGQIGIIQMVAAFTGYFLVMGQHGFFPNELLGIRPEWENEAVTITDSYGQEWAYENRMYLQQYCQSSFFAAIVVTQVADAIICKTRNNTIFKQGMGNWPLNGGILFALVVACTIMYTPPLYPYLLLPPIRLVHWLPGIPFAFLIVIFDEIRRLIIRRRPGGWCEREFYY